MLLRGILLAAAVVIAVAILLFSSQIAEASNNTSVHVTEAIVRFFAALSDEIGEDDIVRLTKEFNHVLRKFAHAFIFSMLGAFSAGFALTFQRGGRLSDSVKLAALGWLAATLYAVGDEIHQAFVPGRGPGLADVIIDSSGAALGAVIALLIAVVLNTKKGYQT